MSAEEQRNMMKFLAEHAAKKRAQGFRCKEKIRKSADNTVEEAKCRLLEFSDKGNYVA